MKKILVTLRVDDYAPDLCQLTFPLFERYAAKIGAEFHVISERALTGWPAQCEKLQMAQLVDATRADWAMFLDADTLVHPDCPDWFEYLSRDTVYHNALDVATLRFDTRDRFFARDGRRLAPGNWCAIASSWTADALWELPPDLGIDDVCSRIRPVQEELNSGIVPAGLADDFILARNAAKYGLKVDTLRNVAARLGLVVNGQPTTFLWHQYLPNEEEKKAMMLDLIANVWKVKDHPVLTGR